MGGENSQRIYENDIIEFALHSGKTYRFLIWYSREMNCMESVNYHEAKDSVASRKLKA